MHRLSKKVALSVGGCNLQNETQLMVLRGYGYSAYHDGKYLVCRSMAGSYAAQLFSFGRRYHFGIYQARAKITQPGRGKVAWLLGFENHPGWASEGVIGFLNGSGTCKARTRDGVGAESTTLTGEDWTTEKTFKIAWSSTSVKFYIDDVLKATHTKRVPTMTMCWFIETAGDIAVYQRDFVQLS